MDTRRELRPQALCDRPDAPVRPGKDKIKRICEEHLMGRYELEIIDVYQQTVLAKDEQILAAPTLIKEPPLRRLIGDMRKTERILLGLDLRPKR